jgi:hypothetical protein
MKKVIFPTLLSVFLGLIGCQKETSERTNILTASKTTAVKRGEPVVFAMAAAQNGQAVQWTVRPDAGVQINTSGHQASIRFAFAGNYTVSGIAGADSASTPVTVTDSVYQEQDSLNQIDTLISPPAPVTVMTPVSTDDTIWLSPVVTDSNGKARLVISATTAKVYGCVNQLLVDGISSMETEFTISYGQVLYQAGDCPAGIRKAEATPSSFYRIAPGSYAVNVSVNGLTYSGVFKSEGGAYSFDWPYTSGVIAAPLVLK